MTQQLTPRLPEHIRQFDEKLRCNHCAREWGAGHTLWCRHRFEEKPPFLVPPPSQTSQLPPARVVPPEEFVSPSLAIAAKDLPAQRGGFKRTEAEIEAERGERGKFVVIQWTGEDPLQAAAYLAEILEKPDGSRVLRNWWPAGEVLPLYPTEQAPDALGRKAHGIMVRIEP